MHRRPTHLPPGAGAPPTPQPFIPQGDPWAWAPCQVRNYSMVLDRTHPLWRHLDIDGANKLHLIKANPLTFQAMTIAGSVVDIDGWEFSAPPGTRADQLAKIYEDRVPYQTYHPCPGNA